MYYHKSHKSCFCMFIAVLFALIQTDGCLASDESETENEPHTEDSGIIEEMVDGVSDLVKHQPHTDDGNIFVNWAKVATDLSDRVWDKLLPNFVRFNSDDSNVTHECAGSIFKIILSARKQETWALKFIDAMGKPEAGLLEGTVTSFGNVEECIDISVEGDGYDEPFTGKYCLLYLRPRFPPKPKKVKHGQRIFDLKGTIAENTVFEYLANVTADVYSLGASRLGICVPSNCENYEIIPMLTRMFERYRIDAGISEKCLSKSEGNELTIHQKVSMGVILLMIVLAFVSALLNTFNKRNERNILTRLVNSWSVANNWNQLVSHPVRRDQRMQALHGMRVLTMYWIIFIHVYEFGGFYKIQWTYRNLDRARTAPESLLFQFICNGFASVETFFYFSGLLFIYTTIPFVENSDGQFNILLLILHRVFRIVPSICGLIAINFLWPLFTAGPILIDDSIDSYITKSCQINWWKNLLLFNNWSDPDHICIPTTWYISADFQLFLLATFILLIYFWHKKLGQIMTAGLLVASFFISGLVYHKNELDPTFLNYHTLNPDYVDRHLKYGYFPTYQHLGPYVIGMIAGYVIVRRKELNISPRIDGIVWISSIVSLLFVVLSAYHWNNGVEPNPITPIIYPSLMRTIWCLALSWITFGCSIGRGGIINKLLSHPAFVPLSKLNYNVYLSHFPVIYILYFTRKSVTDWNHFAFICNAILVMILSTIMSLFLYLLFEMPFNNVEKVLIRRERAVSSETSEKIQNKWEIVNEIQINNNTNNNPIISTNIPHVMHITKM